MKNLVISVVCILVLLLPWKMRSSYSLGVATPQATGGSQSAGSGLKLAYSGKRLSLPQGSRLGGGSRAERLRQKRDAGQQSGAKHNVKKSKPKQKPRKKAVSKNKQRKAKRSSAQNRNRRTGAARLPEFKPRELLVAFPSNADAATITSVAREFGLRCDAGIVIVLIRQRIARCTERRRLNNRRRRQLAAHPDTLSLQRNFLYGLAGGDGAQYSLAKLNLRRAHGIANGEGTLIAILDSGVNAEHPALEGAVKAEFDAFSERTGSMDPHGTAVASIIAARSGMTGIAPGAMILSARAFARSKRYKIAIGETYHLLRSVDWAVAKKAAILNMSFAGPRDPLLHRVLEAATGKGIIAVAAAGNRGRNAPPAYPAAYNEVIAVSATDSRDRLYQRANLGDYIMLAAPGVDILSAGRKRGYRLNSGTSMAAAHVSGSIALILQAAPGIAPATIVERLTGAARDLGRKGRDKAFGYGLLDTFKAVSASVRSP